MTLAGNPGFAFLKGVFAQAVTVDFAVAGWSAREQTIL